MLTFLSLFSGIGGLDLGLERAGMRCVAQVEIDPFCRQVLAKYWPDVPRFDDVKTVDRATLTGIHIDLIVGGFPCQPVSRAGRQNGQADERWLWPEVARLVRELRPAGVLLENTPGLFDGGFSDVLRDLAACGYDAEWDCFPAGAFGAPHLRDRVFVVAYPGRQLRQAMRGERAIDAAGDSRGNVGRIGSDCVDRQISICCAREDSTVLPNPASECARQLRWQQCPQNSKTGWHIYWQTGKSPVPRVAHGIPNKLDIVGWLTNGINTNNSEKKSEDILAQGNFLSKLREYLEASTTPQNSERNGCADSLPSLPQADSRRIGFLGAWIKEDEKLRCLWEGISSNPLEKTQDMQQGLLKRIGQIERQKTLEVRDRIQRNTGLGNAVCPEVAEWIGRRVVTSHAETRQEVAVA